MAKVLLGDLLGSSNVEDFQNFDLTEVQKVLASLAVEEVFNISDCEFLQKKSLLGINMLIDMSVKMIKTIGYIEAKLNSLKNQKSLEYKGDGNRITAEMRKSAGEADPEVEKLTILLSVAKGGKQAIEKKIDLLTKTHYYYKELATNQKNSIVSGSEKVNINEGYNKVGW